MIRVLLVDGTWYLHRAYHVARGQKVPAVRMRKSLPGHVLSMVLKDIEATRASHVAVAFDSPDGFRYKIYPEYKANRMKVDVNPNEHEVDYDKRMRKDEIYSFLKKVKNVLRYAGISVITVPEMEADDIIAAGAVHISRKHDSKVFIATRDKDLMQVVTDRVRLYWPATGKQKEPFIVGPEEVKKIKGVGPDKIHDLLCIAGDHSDNIPGVLRKTSKGIYKRVGLRPAAKILNEHGSIRKAMKSKSKEGRMLRNNKSRLHIAAKLVALRTTCWKPKLKHVSLGKVDEENLVNAIGYVHKNIYSVREDVSISKMKGFFK